MTSFLDLKRKRKKHIFDFYSVYCKLVRKHSLVVTCYGIETLLFGIFCKNEVISVHNTLRRESTH